MMEFIIVDLISESLTSGLNKWQRSKPIVCNKSKYKDIAAQA